MQPCITLLVVGNLVSMLAAIEFDNQTLFQANKIYNVTAYRFLPLEFQSHKAMRTQVIPELLFGIGLVCA